MKIIFLDIDGVLNSEASMRDLGIHNHWNDNPHPMHIKWLNKIIEETGAKIVISSTWRSSGSATMFNRLLTLLGCKGYVIDKTPSLGTFRGTEIKTWLLTHADNIVRNKDSQWYSWKEPVESFVILDDDNDMLELSATNLVLVNNGTGLQEEHALKAIEILNRV